MSSKDYIPIDALFDEDVGPNLSAADDPRPIMRDAEVIVGLDIMSQRDFVIYGREILEEIAVSEQSRPVNRVRIGIDQDTDLLEKLVGLVRAVKGREDYSSMYGNFQE